MLFSALSFGGFEATAIFREETKNPRRTVPRATCLAVGAIGVFYIVATWVVIVAYGPAEAGEAAASDPTAIFSTAVELRGRMGQERPDGAGGDLGVRGFAFGAEHPRPVLLLARCRPGAACAPAQGSPPAPVAVHHFGEHQRAPARRLAAFAGVAPETWYAQLAGTGGFAIMVLMTLTSVAVIVFFRRRRDIRDSTGCTP